MLSALPSVLLTMLTTVYERRHFIYFTDPETKSLSEILSDLLKVAQLINDRGGTQIQVHLTWKPLATRLLCLLAC